MRKAILLGLLTTALAAQEGTGYLQAIAGQDRFGTGAFKNSTAIGLGLGGWTTDLLGFDLRALKAPLDPKVGGTSGNRYYGLGSLNFNFRPGAENWWPYLAVGLGGTSTTTPFSGKNTETTRFGLHGGLGLMGHLSDHVMLTADWKAVRSQVASSSSVTDNLFTVGLGYTFGGKSKAAAPTPAPAAPAPAPAPAPEPPKAAAPVPPPPPPPAPAPEPPKEEVKPVPPPPPPPAPKKIVLDEASLHFANGKADLDADGQAAIRKVAESLKDFSGKYTVVVTGYTSNVGGKAFNKALAKRRADAVAKILVESGVPAAALSTVGAGPDNPIADNKTKEGQAKNRRVEIDVKAEGANIETRKTETSIKN